MSRPGKQQQHAPQPRLRRAYYDCRYGQLHVHNAIPPGGGFDELTSVVCLHGEGESGQVFVPAMQVLGARRSVYALDLPGTGGTDPAPGVEATDAAVHAVSDFLDNMRIRSADLIAQGTSVAAARRLMQLRGDGIRRVVLVDADGGATSVAPGITVLTTGEATPARLIEILDQPASP